MFKKRTSKCIISIFLVFSILSFNIPSNLYPLVFANEEDVSLGNIAQEMNVLGDGHSISGNISLSQQSSSPPSINTIESNPYSGPSSPLMAQNNLSNFSSGFEAFEDGKIFSQGIWDGWNIDYGKTTENNLITIDAQEFTQGDKSLKMQANHNDEMSLSTNVSVEASKRYTIGFWLKYNSFSNTLNSNNKPNLLVSAHFTNGNETKKAVELSLPNNQYEQSTINSDWTYYQLLTDYVPKDMNELKLSFEYNGNQNVLSTVWLDDVVINEKTEFSAFADTFAARPTTGSNMITVNPDFENVTTPWAQANTTTTTYKDGWSVGVWGNNNIGTRIIDIDTTNYRPNAEGLSTSTRSVKISHPSLVRTSFYPSPGGSTGALGDINITSGKSYRVSGWIKCENIATQNVIFRGQYNNNGGSSSQVFSINVASAGTTFQDWKYFEYDTSPAPDDKNKLRVETLLGGNGAATGTIWLDDVRVYELAELVSSINLTADNSSILVGDTLDITASVLPSNATNRNITWHSENENIAIVDANGKVTAIGAGSTNIIATAADGSEVTGSFALTVTNATVLATGISLNEDSLSLYVDDVKSLKATITPDEATNKSITWVSSNTEVVQISSAGVVKAIAPGTANITASTSDGSNITSTACVVTVTPRPNIIGENLLKNFNGDLEASQATTIWSGSTVKEGWSPWFATAGNPPATVSIDTTTKRGGEKSLKIYHQAPARTVMRVGNPNLTSDIAAAYGDEMIFGFWVKYEGLKTDINGITVRATPRNSSTGGIAKAITIKKPNSDGTTTGVNPATSLKKYEDGWEYYELEFRCDMVGMDRVRLEFDFGSNSSNLSQLTTGTAWFDDIYLVKKVSNHILVSSIEFDSYSATVRPNEEYFISSTVQPSNTTETLLWSSSNTNVATVTQSGYVKAISAGTATITAKSSLSLKTATFNLTVEGEPFISKNKLPNGSAEFTTDNASWVDSIGATGFSVWNATAGGKVSVDKNQVHFGGQSIKVEHVGEYRTGISVLTGSTGGVPVNTGDNLKASVWLKTDSTKSVIVRSFFYNNNTKVSDGPLTTITGSTDWKEYNLFANIPAGVNYFRFEVIVGGNSNTTGTVWMDDFYIGLYEGLTKITLDKNLALMTIGNTLKLIPTFEPANANDKTVNWSSSNEKVATVDQQGVVTAVNEGDAIIKVSTPDGSVYNTCTVSIQSQHVVDELNRVRLRYYDRLTGNSKYNPNDADMLATVTNTENSLTNAEFSGSWDTLNKATNRLYLWGDLNRTNNSADLSSTFARLKNMAMAYSMVGSTYYKNEALKDDILSCLDWLLNNKYKAGMDATKRYDNWYHWEISIPKLINDIATLMYDEISEEMKTKLLNTQDWFVPNPLLRLSGVSETGANLLDKANAVTMRGVVGLSGYKVKQGLACIPGEYRYTTKGDGVYEDGSLVQHFNIAYTGGYGAVWLGNTAELMYTFKGSPWEINDSLTMNVFDWIDNVFAPIIYNGYYMDAVNGRGISRTRAGSARGTMLSILRMSEAAPSEEVKQNIKSFIKEVVYSDTIAENYYEGMSVFDLSLLKEIINNSSISRRGNMVGSYVFAGMDRVVHLRENFGFVVSMFSDRISAFEFGNDENLHGWYTGIGMTNIYNTDSKQYYYDYWPTVNSYRLAGTTTDGVYKTPAAWGAYYNTKNWVGGSNLYKMYSAVGMDFGLNLSTGSPLTGKKSWFNFDDEIVAIGSHITNTNGKNVETIVENRMIRDDASNVLTINGQNYINQMGETINNVKYAHLEGNVEGADIGYYFPTTPSIYAMREARTGAWYDINKGYSQEPITRNYVSLAFEHGINPINSSYAYVLLPNKSAIETEAYSENADIEILSCTDTIHAVKEKKLGITAVNFFQASTMEYITTNKPASIMVEESNGELVVSVSDPTQKESSIIVTLDKPNYTFKNSDPNITVVQTSPSIVLEVYVSGAIGKSFTATFIDTTPKPEPIQTRIDKAEPGSVLTIKLTEDLVLDNALTINKPLTLIFTADTPVTVTSVPSQRHIVSKGNVSIELNNVTLYGNQNGGGIYHTGTLNFINGKINGCKNDNGGAIYVDGTIYITNGWLNNNTAIGSGGAVYVSTYYYQSYAVLEGNQANNGGAVYVGNAAFISGGSFLSNIAKYNGGAICLESTATNTANIFSISSGSFTDNKALNGNGGGLYISTAKEAKQQLTTQLTNAIFARNYAAVGGGAIYLARNAYSTNTVVINAGKIALFENTASYGGGINVMGASTATAAKTILNLNASTIKDNSSLLYAGAVYANYATININANTFIQNNTATKEGGAFYISASILYINCSGVGNNTAALNNEIGKNTKTVNKIFGEENLIQHIS